MPETPLKFNEGPSIYWKEVPSLLQAHVIVKDSGTHNYLKCRISVNSHLNIARWEYHLKGYWDQQIVDLLHYGFPLDLDRTSPFLSTQNNHVNMWWKSFSIDIVPCPLHISSLMTWAKQDSDIKRAIIELSWPQNSSVNAGVQKNIYLNTIYSLNYPSIDNITESLVKLCPIAQPNKIDISRAFRHVRVDPADIDLLGFQFDHYIDILMPFGFRHCSLFFQRCSEKKLVFQATSVTCLGIFVDSVNRTISIPDEKLQEIINICLKMVFRRLIVVRLT